jgi:hypothetical protein
MGKFTAGVIDTGGKFTSSFTANLSIEVVGTSSAPFATNVLRGFPKIKSK